MVIVGGVTRLTGSGLSMVDWQPILGILPPMNEEQWRSLFAAYQQFPEYQLYNQQMDLDGFKQIFYWEYAHRVLGRVIGLLFFLPMVGFWISGRLAPWIKPHLIVALVLGGLQGLLGWYMVQSGLVDDARVSHYRLAAHLLLAMGLMAYVYWLALACMGVPNQRWNQTGDMDVPGDMGVQEGLPQEGLMDVPGDMGVQEGLAKQTGVMGVPQGGPLGTATHRGLFNLTLLVLGLLAFQLLYGAFTAGSHAGYGYNTFPLMHDRWVAEAVMQMTPWWLNLTESTATIQFVHRWLAVVLVAAIAVLWWRARRVSRVLAWSSAVLLAAVLLQFMMGVLTLVKVVPLGLASAHQGGACIVLLAAVHVLFLVMRLRSEPRDRNSGAADSA